MEIGHSRPISIRWNCYDFDLEQAYNIREFTVSTLKMGPAAILDFGISAPFLNLLADSVEVINISR